MRMNRAARILAAPIFCGICALVISGCGGSSTDGATAQADPNLGQRHKEMQDYMKNNKATAVSTRKVRNHP
jgi:hypothetical protein